MRALKVLLGLLIIWGVSGWGYYTYFYKPGLRPNVIQLPPHVRTPPGPLVNWTFQTEQHWMANEIGRDIAEMLHFAKDAKTLVAKELEFSTLPSPGSTDQFTFKLTAPSGENSKTISIKHHFWASENYTPWAQTLLSAWNLPKQKSLASTNPGLIQDLTTSETVTILKESQRISKELTLHPLDAALHEEAALVLGNFAMKEAAGRYSDIRRTLCRISAHLSLARALQEKPTTSGQLAEVVQLSLINRQSEALEKITQLPTGLTAWSNALKIRCTGNWRILPKPEEASILEQMEHGRAIVSNATVNLLVKFLEKSPYQKLPHWFRIARQTDFSVQQGHVFVKPSLAVELQSLGNDWKAWSNTPLQQIKIVNLLNEPATRGVIRPPDQSQQLSVLSWGDIASFHQRHICFSIHSTSYFLRQMWGVPDVADEFDKSVQTNFSGLRLFPFVLTDRAQNAQQYETGMNDALDFCNQHPEFVTVAVWRDLLVKTRFGNQYTKVPDALNWFTPMLPLGSSYDFGSRYHSFDELSNADMKLWEELVSATPYDFHMLRAGLYRHHNKYSTAQENIEAYQKISDYNLNALITIANFMEDAPKDYDKYMRKACEIDPNLYVNLGVRYQNLNRIEDAVFAYQAAFELADDRVFFANGCDWIVNYYYDHNRKEDALKIATEAAEVYSGMGLETMGKLMVRMGKLDEAEKNFEAIAERYKDLGPLSRFYRDHQDKNSSYAATLKKLSDIVFPEGIKKALLGDFKNPPKDGVLTVTINEHTIRANLKRGDIIVALDGWRVQNLDQYKWVRSFTSDSKMTFIYWNGIKYVEVSFTLPGRSFYNSNETYQAH